MDRRKFESIAQTCGADANRWPRAHRTNMLALLDTDPQARAILGHEAALDSLLNAIEPPVSNTLEARIRNDMAATLGTRGEPGVSVTPLTASSPEIPPLRQAAGAFVVALAACVTLCIVCSEYFMCLVFVYDDMLFALDIVGNEFLN